MIKRSLLLATVLVLGITSALAAHDTWLLPSGFHVAIGQRVTLSLTSGELFAVDDFAIDPKRLARAEVRLAGTVSRLAPPVRGGLATHFTWQPRVQGVAAIAVDLRPRTLTLAADKIDEYFDEIDASPQMRAEWKARPSPKQWRESYVKHATSYVQVGTASQDTGWRTAMGSDLEIVPERDPTQLHAGDTLGVRVLQKHKPRVNFSLGAVRHQGAKVAFYRTDANGRARVVLPAAGNWLLNGTDLRHTTHPGLEWESDFVTLTVHVMR